jgi:predicted ATPase
MSEQPAQRYRWARSGSHLLWSGPVLCRQFESSRSHLEEALTLQDPVSHRSLGHQVGMNPSSAYLGIVLFCLGYPDQVLERSSAAIAEARRLAYPPSLAGHLATGIRLQLFAGDNAAPGEWVDQLVTVITEQSFPHWRAMGTICRGWVKVKNGDVPTGISLLRSGLAASRPTGAWRPHNIALLAAPCEIARQIDEALSLIDGALQIVEGMGERWLAAELSRRKGQLLLRQEHSEVAEEFYRKALSIAKEQGAKLWELRAVVSLARLHRDQGRHAEARDLLAPVYRWFTEGFDTRDLKDAKALLDELA